MIPFDGSFQVIGNPGVRVFEPHPVVSAAIVWVHRADFPAAIGPGIGTPYPIQEGGPLTVVEAAGQFEVATPGIMNYGAGASLGWYTPAITKTAGYALIVRGYQQAVNNVGNPILWKHDADIISTAGENRFGPAHASIGRMRIADSLSATPDVLSGFVINTPYDYVSILRPTGVITAIKGGIWTDWHPYWVSNSVLANTLYAVCVPGSGSVSGVMTRWGVADLVGSGYSDFSNANGLAQAFSAAPITNDTGSIDANGTHYFQITSLPTVAGQTVVYIFRQQDAANYWYLILTKDAGATCTMALEEVIANVGQGATTSASTIAANDWIGILPYSTTIRVVEGAANGTLTTRITKTGTLVSGTTYLWNNIAAGAVIASHSGYPEYLSGTPAAALDALLI